MCRLPSEIFKKIYICSVLPKGKLHIVKVICNKGFALEATLLKTVLILIRVCLFYFNICSKLWA